MRVWVLHSYTKKDKDSSPFLPNERALLNEKPFNFYPSLVWNSRTMYGPDDEGDETEDEEESSLSLESPICFDDVGDVFFF